MDYLINSVIMFLAALFEKTFDQKTAPVIDQGGRTKNENNIIHSWQLPTRGLVVTLSGLFVASLFGYLWPGWIFSVVYAAAVFWLVFELLVNFAWLELSGGFFQRLFHSRNDNGKLKLVTKILTIVLSVYFIECYGKEQ